MNLEPNGRTDQQFRRSVLQVRFGRYGRSLRNGVLFTVLLMVLVGIASTVQRESKRGETPVPTQVHFDWTSPSSEVTPMNAPVMADKTVLKSGRITSLDNYDPASGGTLTLDQFIEIDLPPVVEYQGDMPYIGAYLAAYALQCQGQRLYATTFCYGPDVCEPNPNQFGSRATQCR